MWPHELVRRNTGHHLNSHTTHTHSLNQSSIPFSARSPQCVKVIDRQPNPPCVPYTWDPHGKIPTCQSGTSQGWCDPVDGGCYEDPYTLDNVIQQLLDIKNVFDTSDAIKGLHALDQYVRALSLITTVG